MFEIQYYLSTKNFKFLNFEVISVFDNNSILIPEILLGIFFFIKRGGRQTALITIYIFYF